jgi:hypothetical protein
MSHGLVSREISCLKELCDFGWGPWGRGGGGAFNWGEGELRWISAHKNGYSLASPNHLCLATILTLLGNKNGGNLMCQT